MGKKFAQDEIEFIKNNASNMNDREIANVLGRSKSSIKRKRLQIGILNEKDTPKIMFNGSTRI